MRTVIAVALSLVASAEGFVFESSSHNAGKGTIVAGEIQRSRGALHALRRAASNVVTPAILASSVLVGNMNPAYAADGDIIQKSMQAIVAPDKRTSASPTENYLPRRLYPGTYQNYCGPTPEVQVKGGCVAHGWYSDAPADQVDAACQKHDVAYCNCETQFLQRKKMKRLSPNQEMPILPMEGVNDDEEPIPLLASMVALRFATKSALELAPAVQADAKYFDCIHKADQELIATGIRIRGEQQRAGCSTDPSLAWFCDLSGKGTLSAFEKVNLNIFLKDLDNDDDGIRGNRGVDSSRWTVFRTGSKENSNAKEETLAQIEHKRENDILRGIRSGVSVSEAASSPDVMADEERLLSKLTQ